MGRQCLQDNEKTLLLEIRHPHIKSGAKYEAGIMALTKALGYDSESQQKEISPFRSVRELEKLSKDRVERSLLSLYDMIVTTWVVLEKAGTASSFVLNGRIFLNPKTGKPLTIVEWKIIKKDILKAFDYIYAVEEERIALHALSLGKVLKGMPLSNAINYGYKTLKQKVDATMDTMNNPEWQSTGMFIQQHAAENIVDLKAHQYRKLHDTIQTSIKNRDNTGALRSKLFEQFGEMNRDWRRIAETEIGNAQNNGQIIEEMNRTPEGRQTFMKGISSSEACPWCRNEVDGKIVAVLREAPDTGGDKVVIDGETYTAIWPGKDNVSRPRSQWWVSAGVQHPHCVPGDQVVSTSLLGAVTKAFYEGFVIEISTSSGNRMTVTENHPVLTPNGFVAAKFLTQRDYVITSADPNRLHKVINPYNYQRPTAIENLFATYRHSFGVSSAVMKVSNEDFYGDGRFFNSDVDVVFANRFLWDCIQPIIFKDFKKMLFSGTKVFNIDSFFQKFGSSFKFLQRFGLSPDSILSLFNHLFPFLRGHSIKSKSMSFLTPSDTDTKFFESIDHGISTHSQFSSEFIHRFSGNIPTDDTFVEGSVTDAGAFIVPSRITGLVRRVFSGHVYDLQDDIHGLYTCNGVVVKNCRCTWVGHMLGFEDWDKKIREAMDAATEQSTARRKPEPFSSAIRA